VETNPQTETTMNPTIDEAIATLTAAGYRVTKPRATAGRKPARASGKGHGNCAAHFRLDGFRKPVCVLGARTIEGETLPPQSADEVIDFAEEIRAIAQAAGDVLPRIRVRDAELELGVAA